jgi:hypothetical protein
MTVKKLIQQKKQAEKLVADLNAQIVQSIQPKLQEVVEFLTTHQDVVAEAQEIRLLVAEAVKAVYGEDATVGNEHKVAKRPKGREMTSSFDWQRLVKAMADAGLTSAQKGHTKRELEELYYGDVGVRFEHNKWSDKDSKADWLANDLSRSSKLRRYWVRAKRTKK